MHRLRIELAERSYPILIGPALLDDPAVLAEAVPSRDVLVVTNETVAPLYLGRLTAWSSWPEIWTNPALLWSDVVSRRTLAVLALAAGASFIPGSWWIRHGWDEARPVSRGHAVLRLVAGTLCLVLATAALAGSGYNPFIYFRF